MTNLQAELQRACRELGLKIVVPFELTLSDGTQIHAQALIPQLGCERGMIIVSDSNLISAAVATELWNMGYGYSTLSDDPDWEKGYDLETYIEMFSDWTWSTANQERQPAWMK